MEHLRHVHCNRRFRKGGVDGINRDRIERIGRIATDVYDHTQPPILPDLFELVWGYEGRDRRGEVDAVDENVHIDYFLEWTALGCFV
jgi:hypothetical protein